MIQSTPAYPTLRTARLVLRAFGVDDVPHLVAGCGDPEVAANLGRTPFPYTEAEGRAWIARARELWAEGKGLCFAIEQAADGAFTGGMGLHLESEHQRAELGYWFGKPFWGRGYATEAARAIVDHGFSVLGLRRIFAGYHHWNPASGRVLEKIGMRFEGVQRGHGVRMGRVSDLHLMGMIREDWQAMKPDRPAVH